MKIKNCQYLAVAALAGALLYPAIGEAQVAAKNGDAQQATATPRTAEGKPDFSGYWGRLTYQGAQEGGNAGDIQFASNHKLLNGTVEGFQVWLTHFEKDGQILRRAQKNRPVYKPELWQKMREKDWDQSRKKDPASHCLPAMPRLGMPSRIVQLPNEMIFFYEDLNRYRIIPTDNRPHDPVKVSIPSWFGDSVGHWENDVLVVETVGMIDASWLSGTGNPHTEDMKVTERIRRVGDELIVDKTVEDPALLMQPWQMEQQRTRANKDPKAALWEEAPCDERDKEFEGDPYEGR